MGKKEKKISGDNKDIIKMRASLTPLSKSTIYQITKNKNDLLASVDPIL